MAIEETEQLLEKWRHENDPLIKEYTNIITLVKSCIDHPTDKKLSNDLRSILKANPGKFTSLLSFAVSNNNVTLTEILIKSHYIQSNEANKLLNDVIDGNKLLSEVIREDKNPELAKLLLKYAYPNELNEDGKTLPMLAVEYGRPEIFEILVNDPRTDLKIKDNNADFKEIKRRLNDPDESIYRHKLRETLQSLNLPIADILTSLPRDVTKDSLVFFNNDMSELNITRKQVKRFYEGGCTVVDHIIQQDKPEWLKIAAKNPTFIAALNSLNDHLHTPIMTAINEKKFDSVKDLIKYNPNLKSTNRDGDTILHLLLRAKELQIIELILNNPEVKDIINVHNTWENTALMMAVSDESVEIVEALCKEGASPNVRTSSLGDTALHILALKEFATAQTPPPPLANTNQTPPPLKILDILLKYGIDIDIKNNFGKTAGDIAPGLRDEITKRMDSITKAAHMVVDFYKYSESAIPASNLLATTERPDFTDQTAPKSNPMQDLKSGIPDSAKTVGKKLGPKELQHYQNIKRDYHPLYLKREIIKKNREVNYQQLTDAIKIPAIKAAYDDMVTSLVNELGRNFPQIRGKLTQRTPQVVFNILLRENSFSDYAQDLEPQIVANIGEGLSSLKDSDGPFSKLQKVLEDYNLLP